MSNIMKKLEERLGGFGDYEIDEMIKEFGENYMVGVKYYTHDREMMSLKSLKELSKTNPEKEEDIREAFILSIEYDRLFN